MATSVTFKKEIQYQKNDIHPIRHESVGYFWGNKKSIKIQYQQRTNGSTFSTLAPAFHLRLLVIKEKMNFTSGAGPPSLLWWSWFLRAPPGHPAAGDVENMHRCPSSKGQVEEGEKLFRLRPPQPNKWMDIPSKQGSSPGICSSLGPVVDKDVPNDPELGWMEKTLH